MDAERGLGDIDSSIEIKDTSISDETDAPPDGGLVAWTQVLLMHLVFFNTWGVSNGYGVFQEYYSTRLGVSSSAISWIGGVQVFFIFMIGVAAGRATDAGYFRITFGAGVLLQLVGIFMTSLATVYWQIFLAQAVCFGIGSGLTFVPGLAIMASYFRRKRAFAVGLAAAGAGTGGLVYPTLINQLLLVDDFSGGFPWTIRVMGFVLLVTAVPCLVWFEPRRSAIGKAGPLIDISAFKEPPFVFFALSMFFNFWGLYFAFFYMGTFARDRIGVSKPINLVMVLNGVGIIGRILPTIVADRWTGPLNILIPLSVSASIMIYCWAAVHSEAGLYVFAVLYGLMAAALQSLFPAVATTMTPDPRRTGTRVGMIFSIVSVATLTGPAISGVLIQLGDESYLYAQIFAGTSVLLGAFLAMAARVAKTGLKLKIKM
ncbi:major facilitator superfamily domain-containing protein [Xylariales sp. PMI_506]|nr:major facilitator superfamily domain-containing protein [Xylariales sp. PMI_506]